ncbi:MAG: hypothetical protein AB1716_12285, partial [Planctomycetota bacterium]
GPTRPYNLDCLPWRVRKRTPAWAHGMFHGWNTSEQGGLRMCFLIFGIIAALFSNLFGINITL